MLKTRLNFLWLSVVAMSVLMPAHAWAAAVDIATTELSDSSGQNDWVFTNNVTGATFSTVAGGAPVTFDYESANIGGTLSSQLTGDLAAHLFLIASTSTPGGSFGPFDAQPIDSGTIEILLDTPIDGKDNLLTAQFSNTLIIGFDGGSTPAFSGQDGSGTTTVTFSSDFLTFSGATTGNNFQWTSSNADPGLSLGAGGFLSSFSGNGLSTYGLDTANATVFATPEPATVVLFGIGAIGLFLVARRRRRMA